MQRNLERIKSEDIWRHYTLPNYHRKYLEALDCVCCIPEAKHANPYAYLEEGHGHIAGIDGFWIQAQNVFDAGIIQGKRPSRISELNLLNEIL